jgi:osmotically inducible protein OsmC
LSHTPYSVQTRFGDVPGTNPEELIAAAHAACFSMALSKIMGDAGLKPESIKTTATVQLLKDGDGFAITESHLEVRVKSPGATDEAFQKAAEAAEHGCPISKVLKAKITMDAKLEG